MQGHHNQKNPHRNHPDTSMFAFWLFDMDVNIHLSSCMVTNFWLLPKKGLKARNGVYYRMMVSILVQ
jgi:hypothetical protein